MIAFCTRCWAEVDSEERQCSNCGADFGDDTRSYEELIGENQIHRASDCAGVNLYLRVLLLSESEQIGAVIRRGVSVRSSAKISGEA